MIDIAQILTDLTALPIHDRLRVGESLWDSIFFEQEDRKSTSG